MTYEVLLRPEAEVDIQEAYRWYELQAKGLGEEFIRTLDACFSVLQRSPGAFAPVHGNVRRALLRRFPYCIFYLVESDRVIILGCFHVRRNPRQWQSRV